MVVVILRNLISRAGPKIVAEALPRPLLQIAASPRPPHQILQVVLRAINLKASLHC